jgi:bifunctional non-homologous end joining protein LigD
VADEEELAGVALSSLDGELFDGAGVSKRDLVHYLDGVRDRLLPVLAGRALSVVRVRPGSQPFMQKNLPSYAPGWIRHTDVWSHASQREVRYPLCEDRRTLVWLANQRAVEYHPAMVPEGRDHASHLVIDLDPPGDLDGREGFGLAARTALLVREVLEGCGLGAAVKTSGAKGIHVFVPLDGSQGFDDVAGATRALAARTERLDPHLATTAFIKADRGGRVFVDSTRAGGATVVAAYSPRARPGVPVSFPIGWDDLLSVVPTDLTISTALDLLRGPSGDTDPWAASMPAPQRLPDDLVAEGHTIPVARVQAMHEGRRRKRAAEEAAGPAPRGRDG